MHTILIVEDEEVLRATYHIILSTGPYEVTIAANGQEALDQTKASHFDLILLDLMMPQIDGIGFLKKFHNTSDTKVIVLSNLSSGDMLTEALRLGAYSSAVKADLSPRQLLELVRHTFE